MSEVKYYDTNNKLLTQSKIKDYLKDKEYFYKKHISGEIEEFPSDPMIIGNAIDCWITEGKKAYRDRYYCPSGNRDKKADDYEYQLTDNMEQTVREICEKVEKQPVYIDLLRHYKRQKVLKVKDDNLGPYFTHLAGIPDFIKFDNENSKIIIVDYKTSTTIDKNKYFFKCLDFGYFTQQAMYQMLIRRLFPAYQNIESWHLVTEKDTNKIYNSQVFRLFQPKIEQEIKKLEDTIYNDLAQENKFQSAPTTWDNAEDLGGENNTWADIDTTDI